MKSPESDWAIAWVRPKIPSVRSRASGKDPLNRKPVMNKLRLLLAVLALTAVAACGDLGPTAPQDSDFDLRGILGSGG